MAVLIASSKPILIVGLGLTGVSVARFLRRQGRPFAIADSRAAPPMLTDFQREFPDQPPRLGTLQAEFVCQFDEIILSPGLPREEPAIAAAIAAGKAVIGDIELFLREARAPIVAITGSNGKTTVTTLLGEMAKTAGRNVGVGGNLGTPALDLLDAAADLYVLELSSFQLESIPKLSATAATILNISDDHMDRYGTLAAYHKAKQRIYFGAKMALANRDDVLTQPPLAEGLRYCQFGLQTPDLKDFGLRREDGQVFLAKGLKCLLNIQELKIRGLHNCANALAALALGEAVNLPLEAMLQTLREFTGLPHRCQFVARRGGVDYYNDSKATNVGATLAALNGMASRPQHIVLIAGGDGKGADFSPLIGPLKQTVKALITIGRDGEQLGDLVRGDLPVVHCQSLPAAVAMAAEQAAAGDLVLLSPACASLDMFKNYEERGHIFMSAVEALPQ